MRALAAALLLLSSPLHAGDPFDGPEPDDAYFQKLNAIRAQGVATAKNAQKALPAAKAPAAAPSTPKPSGKITLRYEPAKASALKPIEKALRESKLFDANVQEMDAAFALPVELSVVVKECGEANAFYGNNQITYCYDLMANTARLLAAAATAEGKQDMATANRMALGDALHTFFHELGHALVDILDLPITGKEEDAVDQLATLILISGEDDGGEEAAMVAAATFALAHAEKVGDTKKTGEPIDFPFWDEHSIDAARSYDAFCLIYGKDPGRFAHFTHDDGHGAILPKERAERCPLEYERHDRAWDKILAPHLKRS